MITVKYPTGSFEAGEGIRRAPGKFTDVARIDTDDLEEAYTLMQNGIVTDSWTLLPPAKLTALVPPITDEGKQFGNRSAMIGDVFVRGDDWFVVAPFGFDPINAEG